MSEARLDSPKQSVMDRVGRIIATRLDEEKSGYIPYTPSDIETMRASLRPGDIILTEGSSKVSSIIKYLTQSTWSHAAMYVGDAVSVPVDGSDDPADRPCLIEVNLGPSPLTASPPGTPSLSPAQAPSGRPSAPGSSTA
ncbi:MAG: hypothetical protein AAGE89_12760 [Pseudomonadota bacterium]